jgi:TIR domain
MRAIFISYRRDDAEGEAGRLLSDLVKAFGQDRVFMDVAAIEPGRDFRKVIDQNVASCGVLLAVIGPRWLDTRNAAGNRRLDDPSDFVRLETASALRRDIPVIPVLVHEAKMVKEEELPQDLKDLAYRNAVELTHARWDSDVQVLIKALAKCVGEPTPAGQPETRPASVHQVPFSQPSPAPAQQVFVNTTSSPSNPAVVSGFVSAPLAPTVSKELKIGICVVSLFVPLVGIIMGAIYMFDTNPEKKGAGKLWLIVGGVSFLFACLFWSALSNARY